METKERAKARELVEKFRLHSFPSNNNYDAKQCASICVQEIINLCAEGLSETKYWRQVLTEIQSL